MGRIIMAPATGLNVIGSFMACTRKQACIVRAL